MDEPERRSLLLGVISTAMAEHDRWATLSDTPHITARVDEAMTDLMDAFAAGSIPADCREMASLASAFSDQWHSWQAEVDRQGGSAIIMPDEACWKAWERLVSCFRGVTEPVRPRVESIKTLHGQKVPNRQICEIYGWIDHRGRPEEWRVEEELESPGKHTSNWVDPIEQRRVEASKKQQALADRVKNLRNRKIARATAEPPESLADLVLQKVPLHQIAEILRMSQEQVLAQCDAENLSRPEAASAIQTIPGRLEDDMPEPLARQFDAQESQRERQQEESEQVSNSDQLSIDQSLTLEQQIIQCHDHGLDPTEIAERLTTEDERVTRQKVQAVVKRYQNDPESMAMPG